MKKICPICKVDYRDKNFCPSCGLPWEVWSNKVDSKCFGLRPEYTLFDYQLCPFCETPNVFEAHYCRKCGKNIYTQAIDKKGHGWVDLGLSVLWATETLEGLYCWNDSRKVFPQKGCFWVDDYQNDGKDPATERWGNKWRTPTKEEFEELITKCKWEKSLKYSTHALKVTGPNGNSIFLSVVDGCHSSSCRFWTSTAGKRLLEESSEVLYEGGYAFSYIGFKDFPDTLTKKQKLERKWGFSKENDELLLSSSYLSLSSFNGNLEEYYMQDHFQKRKILDEMGDDWRERDANRKRDEEERRRLWLETPIEMNLSNDILMQFSRTVGVCQADWCCAIHPVADKKWQGKL